MPFNKDHLPRDKHRERKEASHCLSMELAKILEIAEAFRAIEQAPAVRVDHFLLALIIEGFPPNAEKVLEVFEKIKNKWHKDVNGETTK